MNQLFTINIKDFFRIQNSKITDKLINDKTIDLFIEFIINLILQKINYNNIIKLNIK